MKHPSVRAVPLLTISTQYGMTHFCEAFARFVALSNQPNLTRAQLECAIWGVHLPFNKLAVWHRVKYLQKDPVSKIRSTADSIHCQPERLNPRGNTIPVRFNTALINDGSGENMGIEGAYFHLIRQSLISCLGYRIGRIRVVFSLPERSLSTLFNPGVKIPALLAYVQWFSPFPNEPDWNHLLYKIKPLKDTDRSHIASVIPLKNIRHSAHLIPKFGSFAPQEWTSSTVLDLCDTFFINTFTDRHFFRVVH